MITPWEREESPFPRLTDFRLNKTGLILSLGCTAVVAAGSFALWPKPTPQKIPTQSTPLPSASIDAASVSSIAVRWPNTTSTLSIRRDDALQTWLLKSDTEAAAPTFLAEQSRVRSLIEEINAAIVNASNLAIPADPASPGTNTNDSWVGTDAATIELADATGTRTILIGQQVLSGRAKVAFASKDAAGNQTWSRGWCDATLSALVAKSGAEAWRSTQLLAVQPSDVTELTLLSAGRTVRAVKLGGQWQLGLTSDPLSASNPPIAANAGQVQTTLQTIAALNASKVIGALPARAEMLGLQDPSGVIETVVPIRRIADGRVTLRSLVQRVTIGSIAETDRSSLYATVRAFWREDSGVETPVLGESLVTISRDALTALTGDPAAFTSQLTVSVPRADLGMIKVSEARTSAEFSRGISGWNAGSATEGTPLSSAESRAIESALSVLSTEPAASVLFEKPGDTSVTASATAPTFTLARPSGETVATICFVEVGTDSIIIRESIATPTRPAPAAILRRYTSPTAREAAATLQRLMSPAQ
jgi:hypothetical protein